MALSPAVLEACIRWRVSELRVLAAKTAMDWDAQACERELAKRDNPLVRRLARALLDASKTTLDEARERDPLVRQLTRALLDASKTTAYRIMPPDRHGRFPVAVAGPQQ